MKKLKDNIALLSALVAVVLLLVGSVSGAILYAESTYMKSEAANQQFRDLRLDGLYRDLSALEAIKAKRKLTEYEQAQYDRVQKAIKLLEEGKK